MRPEQIAYAIIFVFPAVLLVIDFWTVSETARKWICRLAVPWALFAVAWGVIKSDWYVIPLMAYVIFWFLRNKWWDHVK